MCHFDDAGVRGINTDDGTDFSYFPLKPQDDKAKNITVSNWTFIGSTAPNIFGGGTVEHNAIYRSARSVLFIMQKNQGSKFALRRNGVYSNVSIVFRIDELSSTDNFGSGTELKSLTFSSNIGYRTKRPENARRMVKLPTEEKNSIYGQDSEFTDSNIGDFRLKSSRSAKGLGPRAAPK